MLRAALRADRVPASFASRHRLDARRGPGFPWASGVLGAQPAPSALDPAPLCCRWASDERGADGLAFAETLTLALRTRRPAALPRPDPSGGPQCLRLLISGRGPVPCWRFPEPPPSGDCRRFCPPCRFCLPLAARGAAPAFPFAVHLAAFLTGSLPAARMLAVLSLPWNSEAPPVRVSRACLHRRLLRSRTHYCLQYCCVL